MSIQDTRKRETLAMSAQAAAFEENFHGLQAEHVQAKRKTELAAKVLEFIQACDPPKKLGEIVCGIESHEPTDVIQAMASLHEDGTIAISVQTGYVIATH